MPVNTAPSLQSTITAIREVMDEYIYPLEPYFLNSHIGFRTLLPSIKQIRQTIKDRDLWTPHLPKEFGGKGLTLTEFAHISQELGRSPLGHFAFNCQAPDIGNMELLLAHATDEQKQKYFLPLTRGEVRSCFSMTEPEHPGSNPAWLGTVALKQADSYLITGHKWFTSAADGAAFAIVMAITHPEADNLYRRASMIIVPMDTPGLTIVRNISVMGHSGEDYPTHAEIRYDNCRVPLENLLGPEGEGFSLAQERLGPGRIHHCMRWIGICERAFDLMCKRAASRHVAPGKLLGEQGTIQTWIAESRAEINAARLMVLHTAERIDVEGQYAARDDISLIKFYVAGVLQHVLDHAIQVHGALGITDDLPLAYWYRHERAACIYDGPDEVHKISVARRILARYMEK